MNTRRLFFRVRGALLTVTAALLVAVPQMAQAVFNANLSGTLSSLAVYSDGDYVYLRLTNQPTTHPGCNPNFFVIAQDVPENRRNQMLAMLLAAKASGEPINIGYDNIGDCAHTYMRVHRVG